MIRPLLLLALVLPAAATAQVQAPRMKGRCIDTSGDDAGTITARGILRRETHSNPIGKPERTYMLHLPRATCADDNGKFSDPAERITTVQIDTSDKAKQAQLAKLVGKSVRVVGDAMPRNTGHHYAPLLIVDPITSIGR